MAYDCRYERQSHEVRVDDVARFAEAHRALNGYDRPGDPVEVIAVRATATMPAPVAIGELCAPWVGRWDADAVRGPLVVSRDDCTIWIPKGWTGAEGPLGSLVLRRDPPAPDGPEGPRGSRDGSDR